MARTLTSAAATEAAKQHGAFPRRILEVQFPSPTGTKFYSSEALTSPVTAEGRIRSIGNITVRGEPGKGGNVNSMSIELRDDDLFFKDLNETKPGFQNVDAFLWLWFEGTTWPDDRILDFGGVLTAPMQWSERTASFSMTMKGFEHKYDKEIGQLATADIFTEIDCAECENALIPIVYGNPCQRVPACVIDRPGQAVLSSALNVVPDTSLSINATASEAGFTSGSTISLAVGSGGRWERVTGSFATGSSTSFSITSRGAVDAEGTTAGLFGSGGFSYILVPRADITNPDTPRTGHPLYINDNSGTWHTIPITHWSQQGTSQAIAIEGNLNIPSGSDYKIGSLPGFVPSWPIGTNVAEIGTWKYVVNYLPSKSVDRVEARVEVETGAGARVTQWLEINSAHYTVDNDDRAFNTALGRLSTDPGLTTVTLNFHPKQLGINDETVFITLRGIISTSHSTSPGGSFGDAALENPADVIEHLLTNEFLGNVPSARVDANSFSTAAAAISTKCSFAILNEKARLNDITSDLAYQGNSILFWDAGKATMKALERPLQVADSELTITRGDYSFNDMLKIEDVDIKQYVTELQAKFRPAVPASELVLVRDSSGAKDDFGMQRDTLDLWAYQFPTSVALVTEFWLEYFLETNRRVTFTTFLNAVKIQPGDVITLDIDDGAGNIIFDSVLAQVIAVNRQPGSLQQGAMERVTITCELKLYDYTISTATPSDVTCIGHVARRALRQTGKLFLQSSGTGRSLFVNNSPFVADDGGANIQKPIQDTDVDPDANFVMVGMLLIEFVPEPPCP